MKQNYWNFILLVLFFIIVISVISLGAGYKKVQNETYKQTQNERAAVSMSKRLDIFIQEKKNATLTIALMLSQNKDYKTALINRQDIENVLAKASLKLRQETDFKNVWIQLVDAKGISVSRSWTHENGDDLKDVRTDIADMMLHPKIRTSISVGKYDLSIKAMVPFFDEKNKYIGFLETITHFNSIGKKLREDGYEPIFLVDKSYKNQLTHPFTTLFCGEYYIANKDADKNILQYINKIGVEHFVKYKNNFSIPKDNKYFIINNTLFDENKRPMAYILMFKKLSGFDSETLKNNDFIVNLFMGFTIIAVLFLFILFADKENKIESENKNSFKYPLIYFALFVVISSIYYELIRSYNEHDEQQYISSYNNNIQKDYQIINNIFKSKAEIFFTSMVDNQNVSALMKKAYTKQKDTARTQLYVFLKNQYGYMKSNGVRQLHFHLNNNESFLRFHRPQKYGDNLSGVRSTVEWVNANHEKVEGFEEGRIFNGFRYVFPLIYLNDKREKEYVGSVEISFSAHAIASEFAISHKAKIGFLIKKDVVDSKVFHEEQTNYISTEFKNFYYEKAIKKQLESGFLNYDVEKISLEDRQKINNRIFQGEVFSTLSKDEGSIFTFMPLKNPVTKKIVACIILQEDNRILAQQNQFFKVLLFAGWLLILLVCIFIYREFIQKIKFLDLSLQTQSILDMQRSIVIITNGKEIFEANKKFLEFFGYDSLEKFKLVYQCICDHFIEDKNYYHLGRVPQGENWVSYLEKVAEKHRIVLMKDIFGVEHSFAITYSNYKNNYFILTFTDISGTVQEQLTLEDKVIHDNLTGAFNREFFDKQISKIIKKAESEKLFLGLIIFDIDYFKTVNDTYGHNIGDSVLKELVKRVEESIRKHDYLIRWGGEEFIVLMSTESIEEAVAMAEHLRSMIENHHFDEVEKVTCSFGVTIHLEDELIPKTVQRADKALYHSKEHGRNQVTRL